MGFEDHLKFEAKVYFYFKLYPTNLQDNSVFKTLGIMDIMIFM